MRSERPLPTKKAVSKVKPKTYTSRLCHGIDETINRLHMANKKYIISNKEQQMVAEPIAEYASTLNSPIPTQITVNIEDASMLKEIKRAISMIRGVVSIEKSPAMKSYERARADVKAGRVVECKDKEDFFAKIGL